MRPYKLDDQRLAAGYFDPPRTLQHAHLPKKENVIYGITPAVEDFYVRAHARKIYHVVIQKRIVPPEVAEQTLQLVLAHSAVNTAECSLRTSQLLASLPGFAALPISLFPNRLWSAFGALGGVTKISYTNMMRQINPRRCAPMCPSCWLGLSGPVDLAL